MAEESQVNDIACDPSEPPAPPAVDSTVSPSEPSIAPALPGQGQEAAAKLKDIIESQATVPDSEPRLNRRDKVAMLIFLVLGILGTAFWFWKEHEVFPDASLNFKLPKEQIMQKSVSLARTVGYDKPNTINSIVFSYNSSANTFLSYNYGTGKANELMQSEVPVFYWRTRLCKEFDQEEFTAEFSPEGKLTGFRHHIPDDRALPTASQAEAESLAKDFIEKECGISLAKFQPREHSSTKLLHRTDYRFTWEDQTRDFKGAFLRVGANVSGNKVSAYDVWLQVPETWQRQYSTIRSYNELLSRIAFTFIGLLTTVLTLAFFWALSKRNIRWKFTLGCALTFSALSLLDTFNEINYSLCSYSPTGTFKAFIFQFCISALLQFIPVLMASIVVCGATEVCYRLLYPQQVALENVFTQKGLTTKSVLLGLILGIGIFGISMGWQASYYFIGKQFGFWCPLGIGDYRVFGSICPAIGAILTGLQAATYEEALCRVVCLGLLQKVLKNFWVANFLQAIIWGFAHSTYPQQPCYARGIELTLEGLFLGWVIRRYGLIPCLVSHYLFDAVLGVVPLIESGIPSQSLIASTSVLPPLALLIAAIVFLKKSGRFSPDASVANDAVIEQHTPARPVETAEPKSRCDYQPLSKRMRLGLIVTAVLGIALMAVTPVRQIKYSPVLRVTKQQALAAARQSLDKRHISRNGLYEVVGLSEDSQGSLQYIYEQLGFDKTNELAQATSGGYQWNVHFFKPMDPQEYRVAIDGESAAETWFQIDIPEDAPGAQLAEADARKLCEDAIKTEAKPLPPYVFDSSSQTKRKNRTDYSFTFKVPTYKAGDADYKLYLQVVGDKVSDFRAGWDIPEKWYFERSKHTLKDEICDPLRSIFQILMGLAVLWWGIEIVRSGTIRWGGPALRWAIVFGLLNIPDYLNDLPGYFRSYSTTTPIASFITMDLLRDAAGIVGSTFSAFVAFVFTLAVLKKIKPEFSLKSSLQVAFRPTTPEQQAQQKQMWLDAVITLYSCAVIGEIGSHLTKLAYATLSPEISVNSAFATVCGAGSVLNYALTRFSGSAVIGCLALPVLAAGIYSRYIRSVTILIVFALVDALLLNSSERYWQNYAIDVVSKVGGYAIAFFLLTRVVRTNALTLILMGLFMGVLSVLPEFLRFGQPVFLYDTVQLCALSALPLMFVAYLCVKKR